MHDEKRVEPYRSETLGNGDRISSFRLTRHRSQDESPSWSPDGEKIAWSSNRTGNYDIFAMDRDGGNKGNLTNHNKEDKDPEWRPPWGAKIVFSSDRDGDGEIFLMDANGGNVTQLTNNTFVWDGNRTWSPSGKELAFSTNAARQSSDLAPSVLKSASTETQLLPNYPNPFNPETWIPYRLGKPVDVALTIYDMNGRALQTLEVGHQPSGVYQSRERAAHWDGRNQQGESVANGVYFFTLKAGDFSSTRKMLVGK